MIFKKVSENSSRIKTEANCILLFAFVRKYNFFKIFQRKKKVFVWKSSLSFSARHSFREDKGRKKFLTWSPEKKIFPPKYLFLSIVFPCGALFADCRLMRAIECCRFASDRPTFTNSSLDLPLRLRVILRLQRAVVALPVFLSSVEVASNCHLCVRWYTGL